MRVSGWSGQRSSCSSNRALRRRPSHRSLLGPASQLALSSVTSPTNARCSSRSRRKSLGWLHDWWRRPRLRFGPMRLIEYGLETVAATRFEGQLENLRTLRTIIQADEGLREREMRKLSVLSKQSARDCELAASTS